MEKIIKDYNAAQHKLQLGPEPVELQRSWVEKAIRVRGLRRLYSLGGVDVTPEEFDDESAGVELLVSAIHRVAFTDLKSLLERLLQAAAGEFRGKSFLKAAAAQLGPVGVTLKPKREHLVLQHVHSRELEHDWSLALLHVCGGVALRPEENAGVWSVEYVGRVRIE